MKHPEDRLGDAAGEDHENIHTDWSKPYEIEEEEDVSEIKTVQTYGHPKPRLRKWNKVSFQDDLDKEESRSGNIHTVFAEIGRAHV